MAQNVLQRFAGAVGSIFARGEDPRRISRYFPLPMQAAGITLTYDAALQLSVVWACMDAITKAIASSHWGVFERKGRARILLPDNGLSWLLNTRPNPEMTAIAFRECLLYQALSWGNGYAEIVRDGAGRVAELWPLMSDRVAMRRRYNPDGSAADIVYEYFDFNGGSTWLLAEQVYHLRGPSPQAWLGDNMVARAAKTIALGVAAERFSSSFFANGATAGLVLKAPHALTDKAYNQVVARWNDEHLGPDKASRVGVLDAGWDVTSTAAKPAEMDLTAMRRFQLEEICRFFGVPPHKVQHLDRATFNNIEHLGLEFVRDALAPWAERLEQEADFKLVPKRSTYCTKVDTEWLAHGDAKSRAEAYEKYRYMGVMSANDILEREGRNTLGPEGDVRVLMANYTTYEGIQAMVDQTNLENAALLAGKPDPTPTLKDTPTDSEDGFGGGATIATSAVQINAQAPAASSQAPATTPQESARVALAGAVQALLSGSLERYGRRLQTRKTDLELRSKKTPQQIEAAMASEREKLRPKLAEELEQGLAFLRVWCAKTLSMPDFLVAADDVDNGISPDAVANALVSRATGNGAPISGYGPDVPRPQSGA